ncbi:MAG: hypothetical protein IPM17_00140 [Verrucomicrobia bacterium]|nr:hypothetical protein [Verrucomicrobiota bacterium]
MAVAQLIADRRQPATRPGLAGFPPRPLRAAATGWVSVVLGGWLVLAEPPPADSGTPPALGKVSLDRANRSISFPASVNQRRGLVEYVIVTERGKTHESVLRTDVEPQHIHLALLLLDAQPPSSPEFPADPAAPLPGVPVRIEVSWAEGGREVRRPLEDLVITTNRGDRLARGPWAYNGSYISRGTFVAQQEGSIVALQVDPSALINNPRPGRENDELHHANPATLPPDDRVVTVSIRLLDVTRTNTPILRVPTEKSPAVTGPEAAPPI